MFRFLADRYPLIMQRLDEDHVFDHFYLDMNGIIHQCTHPSDSEIAFEDFDTMCARIFRYTERLFRIVAPTTLMFLAVDGVAPRAKMNQQRSRRFRSAKDAERNMAEAIARGDEIPNGRPFDSNCITPGTQFMYDLSIQFRKWIHNKMSTDVAFQQGCTIVFSGPEVPGEGEHKIMDYIRRWKQSDNFDPATRHCMYGLDADLMMLGLVTHVPFFTLLRERMRFSKNGRIVPKMSGTDKDADEFELLEVAMLRDMLFLEFKRGPDGDPFERPQDSRQGPQHRKPTHRKQFEYNSRRIVDDFVFMCMLVGNDFIPNIPHLDISDGAINDMFSIYKRMVPEWGGYLTDRHRLHPDRLESFLAEISQTELQYFHNRARTDGVPEYSGLGYRRAYYLSKFKFDVDNDGSEKHIQRLRKIYMEGLHWVLQYYHNGVSSWNWFYPDFYAILASDMKQLRYVKVAFKRGRPFRPLTQLMSVLPPESAQFLPVPMQDLMTNPLSPVVDFYPVDFVVDLNGKRNDWEAVVAVPFIDEKRLLKEVNAIDRQHELTVMERKRDENGREYWFRANKYPRANEFVRPVRPSKFAPPKRSRTPSPSRQSGNGYTFERRRMQPGSPRASSSKQADSPQRYMASPDSRDVTFKSTSPSKSGPRSSRAGSPPRRNRDTFYDGNKDIHNNHGSKVSPSRKVPSERNGRTANEGVSIISEGKDGNVDSTQRSKSGESNASRGKQDIQDSDTSTFDEGA